MAITEIVFPHLKNEPGLKDQFEVAFKSMAPFVIAQPNAIRAFVGTIVSEEDPIPFSPSLIIGRHSRIAACNLLIFLRQNGRRLRSSMSSSRLPNLSL